MKKFLFFRYRYEVNQDWYYCSKKSRLGVSVSEASIYQSTPQKMKRLLHKKKTENQYLELEVKDFTKGSDKPYWVELK